MPDIFEYKNRRRAYTFVEFLLNGIFENFLGLKPHAYTLRGQKDIEEIQKFPNVSHDMEVINL